MTTDLGQNHLHQVTVPYSFWNISIPLCLRTIALFHSFLLTSHGFKRCSAAPSRSLARVSSGSSNCPMRRRRHYRCTALMNGIISLLGESSLDEVLFIENSQKYGCGEASALIQWNFELN